MSEGAKTCFMAMPITVRPEDAERYGDDQHWKHVMETLFEPALRRADFMPIRPIAMGSAMIHGEIIKNLSFADLALVDLSSHNPNVFFELGVRTSLNLPVALVAEEGTRLPFDTSGINTHHYDPTLKGWKMEDEVAQLSKYLLDSAEACAGTNPMWRHFGLTVTANRPSAGEDPQAARLELLNEAVERMTAQIEYQTHKIAQLSALVETVPPRRSSNAGHASSSRSASSVLEPLRKEIMDRFPGVDVTFAWNGDELRARVDAEGSSRADVGEVHKYVHTRARELGFHEVRIEHDPTYD